jgi:hypothetical protein
MKTKLLTANHVGTPFGNYFSISPFKPLLGVGSLQLDGAALGRKAARTSKRECCDLWVFARKIQ